MASDPNFRVAWATASVAVAVCLALYGFIVVDAWRLGEWIHIMTLTPLMPFLLLLGLARRHRHSGARGAVLLIWALLLASVFLLLFWRCFTPQAPHVAKALVKGALPIGATALTAAVGGMLELHRRRNRNSERSNSSQTPVFEKY